MTFFVVVVFFVLKGPRPNTKNQILPPLHQATTPELQSTVSPLFPVLGCGVGLIIFFTLLDVWNYWMVLHTFVFYDSICWAKFAKCRELNRIPNLWETKNREKTRKKKKKTITRTRQYLRDSAICLRPRSCRDFTIIREEYRVQLTATIFSLTQKHSNNTLKP